MAVVSVLVALALVRDAVRVLVDGAEAWRMMVAAPSAWLAPLGAALIVAADGWAQPLPVAVAFGVAFGGMAWGAVRR
jgi:hypothetical protein